MAKLPIRVQQYQVGSRRADAADFGAIEGQAQQQFGQAAAELGDTLMVIEERKRNRADVIHKVTSSNTFDTVVDERHTLLQKGNEMLDPESPKLFSDFMKEQAAETLGNYKGSAAGRDALALDLEQKQGAYNRIFYKETISVQYAQIERDLKTKTKVISDLAGDFPESIHDRFAEVDALVREYAPTLTPEQEQAFEIEAKASVIQSIMGTYLGAGDHKSAATVLGTKGVDEILNPDVHRQLKTQIMVGQREDEKGKFAAEQELQELTVMLGREPTAAERARKAGVAPPVGAKTLSDEITEFEQVVGRPATDAEVTKKAGMLVEREGTYPLGKSLPGLASKNASDLAVGFAHDTLTPEQQNTWDSSMKSIFKPIELHNTVTGVTRLVPPMVEPFIIDAYAQNGEPLPVHPGVDQTVDGEPSEVREIPYEDTIWGMRENLAGIGSGVQAAVGQTPFGDVPGLIPPDLAGSRKKADRYRTQLIDILRRSGGRYFKDEIDAIKKDVNLVMGAWSSETTHDQELVALDASLKDQAEMMTEIAMNDISMERTRAALDIVAGITVFRRRLAAPQKPRNQQDYDAIPIGTKYIKKDGSIWTKKPDVSQ